MLADQRAPCIVGVAQRTVHPGSGPAPEPLALWEQVCRAAADDTGAAQAVLDAVASLQIVYCQSWPYDDPVGRLAARLGLDPPHRLYSGIGGTTPQVLVQTAAGAILDMSTSTTGAAIIIWSARSVAVRSNSFRPKLILLSRRSAVSIVISPRATPSKFMEPAKIVEEFAAINLVISLKNFNLK